MEQYTTDKDNPKTNDPKTLLQDAFSEYKRFLEDGDAEIIANICGEKKRNVQEYLRGQVASVKTGQKIFAATRKLIIDREKEVKKLVA